jgi:molybdopterin biosynthesis enzyme
MAFALRDPAVKAIRLADAVAAIRAHLCPILDTELVDLSEARGRVLAEDLIAKISLPHWDSAAVDGFALRAGDVLPGRADRLTVVGEAQLDIPSPELLDPAKPSEYSRAPRFPRGPTSSSCRRYAVLTA